MGREDTWKHTGEDLERVRCDRVIEINRPCSCGCDYRDGAKGVGYIIGSLGNGSGATIWIESEEVFNVFEQLLKGGGDIEVGM